MPIVIPTTDEIERMTSRQKAAWRRRMGLTMQQASESRLLLIYGDQVKNHGEIWARIYGEDPDAAEHVRVLMEAIA